MVLLAGDTPVTHHLHLQSIDQREVVKATGAGFVQLRTPATAVSDVAQAFYLARAEHCPVVLNMPANFMWDEIEYAPRVLEPPTPACGVAEGADLDAAIGMIASARRPLILAGGGAVSARGRLMQLANQLEAPLATTLKAKDLFRGHPYNIGIFGSLSTSAAYDLIGQSDCIVCFGTRLSDFTTDRGRLMEGKRIVQVDIDPAAIAEGRHPDVVLHADSDLAADTILYWLDEAGISPSGITHDLASEPSLLQPPRPNRSSERDMDYVRALEILETVLPQDRVLVTDGGRFMTEVWCRISVKHPKDFVLTANFGSIGLGMQEAIGAGMGVSDRPVVMFTGDGGFMMGGINEFNTAVRLGLDLIVIVANDAAYGAEYIQFLNRQMDPSLTEFQWPSFAGIANALGGQGFKVSSEVDLHTAAEALAVRDRPVLIELVLDPHEMPAMRI